MLHLHTIVQATKRPIREILAAECGFSTEISSFSIENDTIPPHGTSSIFSPQHLPSESPFTGPLNFSIASRSSSSPHITISPIDFSSFTTDQSQQSWLPTPPPTQPLASSSNNSNSNNNNNNNNSALEDFVLYPAPSAPQSQPPPRDSRLLAPSSTTLRPSALQPFLAQNHPRRHSFSLQLQRHLQQQFSGSPVPDPRVTKLARSPSHWSHPNKIAHTQQLHAASVPSRSPHHPLVSQFSATHKNHVPQATRRNMSTPNFSGNTSTVVQGTSLTIPPPAHTSSSDHDAELFGLPSAGLTSYMASPFQLSLDSDHGAFSPAPQGTVSPKDIMNDGSSFPPSTTFTDMSTPSFESPGAAFSSNTSPMFADLEVLNQHDWAPLFDDATTLETLQTFGLASLGETEPKQTIEQPVAPLPAAPKRLSASKSTSSPIPATGSAKPSSVTGISRPRKELSPIAFDPNDPVAAKRARNTEAARKSRAKKLERQMSAEAQIAELRRQVAERDELIASLQAQLKTQQQFS
ncbi:Cross-pathway control protein A [Penicillium rolfsii]|nr:Cross-pathway control protein A [Penicillium rolfsii]